LHHPLGRVSRFGWGAPSLRTARSRRPTSPQWWTQGSGGRLTAGEDPSASRVCLPLPAWNSPSPRPSPGREGSMHTARIVALLAAFSCAASAARAQYPQRRDGFWIGFGLGYGSANLKCDQCVDSSGVGGVTGFVKLGVTPSRNVLIGGGVDVRAPSRGAGGTTADVDGNR